MGGLASRAIPDRCDIVSLAVSRKVLWLRMSGGTHISTLYCEFADALRDVLAENAVGLASRGRLVRTRAAVKKHPDYSEHEYFLAVEMAFKTMGSYAKHWFATKDLRPLVKW
jgi:hypothetical protein